MRLRMEDGYAQYLKYSTCKANNDVVSPVPSWNVRNDSIHVGCLTDQRRYPIPNDDAEQNRDDMKHAMMLELTR